MATRPRPAWWAELEHGIEVFVHRKVVAADDNVNLAALEGGRDDAGLAAVRADAGEADFAVFLGDLLGLEEFVGNLLAVGAVVDAPNIQVIGTQLAETGVEVSQRGLLGAGLRLAGEYDALAPGPEDGADHALVITAAIDPGGVEVVDAQIGGPLDHARVRSDHATEADGGHLQSGPAERAVL